MARPKKVGLEYFPLDCQMDDKIEMLEAEHGLEGFAVYIKLLQACYQYDDGKLDMSVVFRWKTLGKTYGIPAENLRKMVDTMFEIGLFDKKIFDEEQKLTSNGIQKRILQVTALRERERNRKKESFPPENRDIPPENEQNDELSARNSAQKEKEKEIEREIKEEREAEPAKPIAAVAAPLEVEIDLETESDLLSSLEAEKENESPPYSAPPPSLHQQMMDVYFGFYQSRIQLPPKIDGADGNALKTITAYMRSVSKNKDDTGALQGFKWLFDNWEKLEPFLQGQLKLTQISSNLTNLVAQIKNWKPKTNGKHQTPKLTLAPNGIESNGRKPFGNL